MKKQSFEFTPLFLILCVLIFIVAAIFTSFIFFWNSHFFCSAFEINSSCKISLMKGEDFDEKVSNKSMKGLSFWNFIARKDYDKRKNSLKNSCEKGNQISCFYHGLNLKTDGQDFNSFFINSCEKGSVVSACYESGLEFLKLGRKDKSQYYFLKACNSGNILSCILYAYESESEEDFKKVLEKINNNLIIYQNSPSFKFVDKNGKIMDKKISVETTRIILDKELSLFFSETSEVFLRMGNTDEGSYYLEKTAKIYKYSLYKIIDGNYSDLLTKNPKIHELIKAALINIEKELEAARDTVLVH